MEGGGSEIRVPRSRLGARGWAPGRGWDVIVGPCGMLGGAIFSSAPREHFGPTAGWRRQEWNLEEVEAYHGGTSRAGCDERQVEFGLVALDGPFRFEYDSRLSRKRDSEQEIRCLTIESGIRMCEANSK